MRLKNALTCFAVVSLALTGCADNTEDGGAPTGDAVAVDESEDLAALVPEAVRSTGELRIGTSPNYPPNEYIDSSGELTGWSVDLTDAVAAKLGLKAAYVQSGFTQILSGISTDTYDMGNSSFTDTVEREATVDFATYFEAGTQWASRTGEDIDPDDACGLRVAGQPNTIQLTKDLPERSAACVTAGEPAIAIQGYADQAAATSAVLLGKADATLGDSPVVAYGVKKSEGKLQLAGDVYDAAPYGWPVAKDSELAPALQAAVQALIDDGTYEEILGQWGVGGGAVEESQINAANG